MKRTILFWIIIPIAVGCFIFSCGKERKVDDVAEYILWYDSPAEVWEDALPLGNGQRFPGYLKITSWKEECQNT